MKRFTVAILAVIYFVISSGIVMNIHYCMGKVSSVEVSMLSKDLCACGSGKKESKCCKTEHKLVKLQDNHKATTADVVFPTPEQAVLHHYDWMVDPMIDDQDQLAYNNHSPPNLSKQDAYLLNCVFRI